jgi:hypothetical protein
MYDSTGSIIIMDAEDNRIVTVEPRASFKRGSGGKHKNDQGRDANAEFLLRAVNSHADLLAACQAALARIESDIESPGFKTSEGNMLRAAIAKATGEGRTS